MSVYIEELLVPLRREAVEGEDSLAILNQLLISIENRPLRSTERRLISNLFVDFMKSRGISSDNKIVQQFSNRFSFEYLPGVNKLGLKNESHENSGSQSKQPAISSSDNNTDHDDHGSPGIDEDPESPYTEQLNLGVPTEITSANTYFICTIQRHKSTLWTSYRLFIDSTQDISTAGSDFSGKVNSPPIMAFGARKLKSGMSNQYLLWSSSDTKLWKEKNAIGKVQRLSSSAYIGRAFDTAASFRSGPPIAISVRSRSIDKLIHIKGVAFMDESSQTSTPEDTKLLSLLESVTQAAALPSEDSSKLLILRSRPPRKDDNKKGMHSVMFGKNCRVRAPSRKNIVIEAIAGCRTATSEWSAGDNNDAPLFQLGKITEDSFALDFHTLTPLQAFTLALAAFDQSR